MAADHDKIVLSRQTSEKGDAAMKASDFIALVRNDPDAFFRDNYVVWHCGPGGAGGSSLSNFSVAVYDDGVVERPKTGLSGLFGGWAQGGAMYEITKDQSGDAAGYFLNWAENSGHSALLSNHADIFFNAEMSGCAFGCVGGPNGSVKVGHHNIRTQGDDTDDDAMRDSLELYGYQRKFLRNQYREFGNGKGAGYVTGIKVGGAWRIYAQAVFTPHYGVDRIANATRLL